MRTLRLVVLVALVSLALSTIGYAQTASVAGTVTDATGAVVQGAEVNVRNLGTNAARSARSGDTGAYSLTNLTVGDYEITARQANFKVFRVPKITLTVSQVLALDIQLLPGAVTEEVQVRADQLPNVELESSQISNLVDSKKIQDLPLITRDPYSLILLSPGTVQSNSSLGGFSVNGARERNNNFLLDGVDNNDTSVPGIPGGLTGLNPDATEEFRVITDNFNAEYGRNNGAIIDVVTKSGTNQLHGSGQWFGRYNLLGARDYFNHNLDFNGNMEKQNPYVRNQFGFSVGGPIIKDKTFFFVNNEWQRFRTTLTNTSVVPTADFKSGVFTVNGGSVDLTSTASPNNRYGLALDPTIAKILALYPNPNGPAVDDLRGYYFFPSASKQNVSNTTAKVDHKLTSHHSLSARYAYDVFDDPNPFHSDFLPGLDAVSLRAKAQNVSGSLTSAITPTLVNEAKFGYNKNDAGFFCTGGRSIFDSVLSTDQYGRGRDYLLPSIAGFGCVTLGDSNGQARRTGTWSGADSLTWVRGRHTMKFGGDYRFVYDNGYDSFSSRDAVTFNGYSDWGFRFVNLDAAHPCGVTVSCTVMRNMADMLFGIIDSDNQLQFFDKSAARTANDFRKFRQKEFSGYAQDSWKIRSNLTVNLGLRYAFYGVPYEANNNLSNLFADPSGSAPFTFQLVGPGTGRQLYDTNKKDFEPRVGFSWDPWKNGKTAIRGGFGIFHDRVFGNLFGNAKGNPPFQQTYQAYPIVDATYPALDPTAIPSVVPLPGTLTASPIVQNFDGGSAGLVFPILFPKRFPTPYSENWNFGVQREIGRDLTLDINYVGSRGVHQLRVLDGNSPDPALVSQLLTYCADPNNAYGCAEDTLQFGLLWYGAEYGYLPFDAVNNNAFLQAGLNEAVAKSAYHGLQTKLVKNFSHGFSAQLSYTYSHGLDNASDPLVASAGNRTFPRNSRNLNAEYGNSDFDIRHRVVVNYGWEIPLGKGKNYLNSGFVGKALEGWKLSGITSYQTGHPFSVFGYEDTEHTGLSSRADIVGPLLPAGTAKNATGPSIDAFALAPFGRAGTARRNAYFGPHYQDWDMVMAKETTITERFKLDFRFEVYNVFNRAQFGQPGNALSAPGSFGMSLSTLGQSDGTTSARQIQTALKLRF